MATVYAVASAKGGVGKTTTTAAVATLLADSGADVVAIDADLGMANLAEAAGVAPGGITLHDVLAGAADPLDAVHEGPAGLRVVPGAADLDAYAAADPSGLREVVGAFDDADYVFVDAGAGLSHDSTLPLGLADETLLVSTAERSALGDTEKTRQLTERLGGSVAGAAITRLDPATAADDGPIDAVEGTLDAPVIGRIPEDDAVLRAAESARPLPLFAPDSPATRAYRDLTRALTGAAIDGPGLAAGGVAEPDLAEPEETDADDPDAEETDASDADAEETDASDADAEETDASDADAEETDAETDSGAEGEATDGVGEAERAAEGDEAAAATADDEADTADDEGDTADDDTADDETDEDIIVADSERAGLGEPGDEEDIIVAAESAVDDVEEAEPEASAEDAQPTESPEPTDEPTTGPASDSEATETGAVAGDTETVGEDHVDGDDLEAMIEDDLGPEQFDDEGGSAAESTVDDEPAADASAPDEPAADAEPPAEPSADDTPESGGEATTETDPASNEAAEADPDDELAGSVPFRDDDTGTMNTVLSEDEADDEEEEDKDGGFFSRLLGR
ncbi:nucleotide-binding protein [Halorubrum kocurii]|uniref:Cobyrinic acid ac-diamide synthase n=1 Tax=Halorubrum kocurii JCM 14978 TaxID=1230456 RepID=M0NWF5_9EURY|nr:P-loop NTPase [Halorubrum kocurii]EMA62292.1 cobyrinic acid ac-diamide synthase [Halorubrum kocurii JCM 14978]